MIEKKLYDSTLARMAGNIAGSLVGKGGWRAIRDHKQVAQEAVDLADEILKILIARRAEEEPTRP